MSTWATRVAFVVALILGALALPTAAPVEARQGSIDTPSDDGVAVSAAVAAQLGMLQTGSGSPGRPPPPCRWIDNSVDPPEPKENGRPRWRLTAVNQERWDELGAFDIVEGGPVYRYECWHDDRECDEPKWDGDDGCYGTLMPTAFCGSSVCQFDALTPGNLALYLVEDNLLEELGDPQPEFNPPNETTLVGFETWLWVPNIPADGQQGPWSIEVPGPVSVTATANLRGLDWDMGDGTQLSCGLAVDEDSAVREGCVHSYDRSSAGEPDNMFQGNVSVIWEVSWTATYFGMTFSSDEPLEAYRDNEFSLAVAESQAIVTG